MLDHILLDVADFGRSRSFYEAALAPLGLENLTEPAPEMVGFGSGENPWFWLMSRGRPATQGLHLAFEAADRDAVDTFHAAALAAAGTDNGAPAPRPDYGASYYAAFVLDPDGNNIEAVCHATVD